MEKPDHHARMIKLASFAIGLCGSVKPERQAEAVVDELSRHYEFVPKEKKDDN